VRKADNLPPSCADVKKCGGLNLLEPCGPVETCNGTVFLVVVIIIIIIIIIIIKLRHTGDNFNSFFFASYMMYPKATPMTQGPKREYVVIYNSSCKCRLLP
jgi:hypothetical protein